MKRLTQRCLRLRGTAFETTALLFTYLVLWGDGERGLRGVGETKAEVRTDKQKFRKGRPVPKDKE